MSTMINMDELLDILKASYALEEKSSQVMKVSGMKFVINSFYAKGLGHVSAMRASGFFGLMKMDTLIVNPLEIDMPLLSYDRVLAMGNDTLIYEIYNTLMAAPSFEHMEAAKAGGSDLPDHDLGAHWYDEIKLPVSLAKKGKKITAQFDELTRNYLKAYLQDAAKAEVADRGVKRMKASVYVEGLLKNGGPSTDVFKKSIGEEKTAELFRTVLFGTEVK